MSSIVEVIQHYQRSIETSQENEARLLHCINKLYKLPIKVEHLQETGVGKTVNSLRKFNGEIGVAAKAVVTKWKAMVAAEEEPMDTSAHTTENEIHDNHNGDGSAADDDDDRNGSAEEDENHNLNNTIHKKSADSKKDKEKDRHREKSHKDSSSKSSSSSQHERSAGKHSSEKTKTSSTHSTPTSSSSVEKDKSHHKSSSSSSKDKTRDRERSEQKDKDRSEKRKEDKKEEASTSHHKSSSSSNNDHGSSSSSKYKHDSSRDKSDKDKAAASSSSSHKSSSKDKDKTKEEKSKDKHRSSSSSSSSGKTSSSANKDEETERKRRHNSDNDSNDFKSPQPPKIAKVHNKSSTKSEERSTHNSTSPPQEQHQPQEDDADDSFDSSMGANFDDVLGMLNVPRKKGKKSLTSTATTSVKPSPSKSSSSSSLSSSNDKPSTSKSNGLKSTTSPPSYSASPSFSAKPTMKLDLLAPTAKLEPLDPSIALELPSISTNYKPMPLNQTVMDVVFNTSSAKPVRTLTDAEALQHGISSKTMRTKIYSGTRTGQVYQVPSLFDMCIRILQKNIDALEYTGGVPFEVLRPVLDKATPQQLFIFEDFNPYVMEDSDELWQHHVQRSYRTQRRLENESWREMFMRCQEEEERKLSFLKDSIKKSQKIAAAPVRKTQLAFVDSMVKPPRNVQRKQEQFGTKAKLVATPAARVAALQTVTPNAAKQGDTRLRTAVNVRDHAQVSSNSSRPKKAPLMQKTLQFMRGRHKR